MIALLALALTAQLSEREALVAFSGTPTVSGAGVAVRVLSHRATLTVGRDLVQVKTISLIKNTASTPARATLTVARLRIGRGPFAPPHFPIFATVDGRPIDIESPAPPGSDTKLWPSSPELRGVQGHRLTAPVSLKPRGTHAIRVWYEVPLGRSGRLGDKRLLAYLVQDGPIGTLDIAVRLQPNTALGLPEIDPPEGWERSARGGWFRARNVQFPTPRLVRVSFYPGTIEGSGD